MATILNSGVEDLLARSYLIEFAHQELIVSVNPGILTSSSTIAVDPPSPIGLHRSTLPLLFPSSTTSPRPADQPPTATAPISSPPPADLPCIPHAQIPCRLQIRSSTTTPHPEPDLRPDQIYGRPFLFQPCRASSRNPASSPSLAGEPLRPPTTAHISYSIEPIPAPSSETNSQPTSSVTAISFLGSDPPLHSSSPTRPCHYPSRISILLSDQLRGGSA